MPSSPSALRSDSMPRDSFLRNSCGASGLRQWEQFLSMIRSPRCRSAEAPPTTVLESSNKYAALMITKTAMPELGLLERFHQTLKTEEVYWRLYDDPQHARVCLAEFRERYNRLRPHWALRPEAGGDPLVPAEVYVGGEVVQIPRWQTWAMAAKAKLDELMSGAA